MRRELVCVSDISLLTNIVTNRKPTSVVFLRHSPNDGMQLKPRAYGHVGFHSSHIHKLVPNHGLYRKIVCTFCGAFCFKGIYSSALPHPAEWSSAYDDAMT